MRSMVGTKIRYVILYKENGKQYLYKQCMWGPNFPDGERLAQEAADEYNEAENTDKYYIGTQEEMY